jgi:hypothetical protein
VLPGPGFNARLKLHGLRRLRAVRQRERGVSGERRPPARGARLPRGEPAVDAPHVEAVVAVRQRAYAVTPHELREADGAFCRAAPSELDLAGVEYPRGQPGSRPALPPGAGLAGEGGCDRQRIGAAAAAVGLVLAVAHAARDAERAPDDRVHREHDHQAAQEQRQRRDHHRVQGAEGRCCVSVRGRHLHLRRWWSRRRGSRGGGGVRQEPPCVQLSDAHLVELCNAEDRLCNALAVVLVCWHWESVLSLHGAGRGLYRNGGSRQ